jgi:cell division protein FtsZ
MSATADERAAAEGADPRVLVVGVGGGGCNAVDHMLRSGFRGVEFGAIDSDARQLDRTLATRRLQIGAALTLGRGAQADPLVGREAAREADGGIADMVRGADVVVVVAGLGAGTGGGAAPVVCDVARQAGALALGVVTLPFPFEGMRRRSRAAECLDDVTHDADTTVVLPGSGTLKSMADPMGKMMPFAHADHVMFQAVRGLADLPGARGDGTGFAGLRQAPGMAMMGVGVAKGPHPLREAVWHALASPLLERMDLRKAHHLLLTFTGGSSLDREEVAATARMLGEATGGRENVGVARCVDAAMGDAVEVVLFATGAGGTNHVGLPGAEAAGVQE